MILTDIFAYSYFFASILFTVQNVITSLILTLSFKIWIKKKKIEQKIDLTQIFFWSLLVGSPFSIIFIFHEIYGSTIILILNLLGGIVGFQFQNRRKDFYKIFKVRKTAKVVVITILLASILTSYWVENRNISSFDFDIDKNKDILELKEKFTIDYINSYVNYDSKTEIVNARLVDSVLFDKIIFNCQFIVHGNKIEGIYKFLQRYKELGRRVENINFLWDYVHDSEPRLLVINYYDSILQKESITKLLENKEIEFPEMNEIYSRIEFLEFFEYSKKERDSLKTIIKSKDSYHIYEKLDSVIHVELYEHYPISSWLIQSVDSIFLVKSQSDIFLYKDFHHTYGLIKPKKLILFNKDGELIDTTFSN